MLTGLTLTTEPLRDGSDLSGSASRPSCPNPAGGGGTRGSKGQAGYQHIIKLLLNNLVPDLTTWSCVFTFTYLLSGSLTSLLYLILENVM